MSRVEFLADLADHLELPERVDNQLKPPREYQMAGWKVRVNYVETDPEDQARRQATLLDVLARSMRKPK